MALNAVLWLSAALALSNAKSPHILSMEKIQNWKSLPDKITSLPGLAELPEFSMFSGYLEVSSTKALHYWFNECETIESKKLIIWFNGGPGCSSMDGLLGENGPLMFDPVTGQITRNPYSWNRIAHTLYIESPAGVGFSYNRDESATTDDDVVAQDTLQALKNFFIKFPSYQSNELYITGESYAGVYIPTLINAIVEDEGWMASRIKGAMIGNGLLNEEINQQSLVPYAYYHGLFGNTLWDELQRYCCDSEGHCNYNTFRNEDCMIKVSQVRHLTQNEGLNLYNLYSDCTSESQTERQRKLHKTQQNGDLKSSMLTLVPTCTNATFITTYLNRRDVQRAIHVHDKEWQLCNRDTTSDNDDIISLSCSRMVGSGIQLSETVLSSYMKMYEDTSGQIKKMLEDLDDFRVLLYFGDVDMACNHLGGEWFVDQLGYEIMTPRRMWFVSVSDGSRQVAGFYKEYDRLTYAIVKGAGHMVPTDKPLEAFAMLQQFLNSDPL